VRTATVCGRSNEDLRYDSAVSLSASITTMPEIAPVMAPMPQPP
jgi:hypothetical protein